MKNELSNIGSRLIELRKLNKLTQQEVVDNINGLTIQMLSSYENNKQKPGIENLIKISKFFNVSLDYLCLGKKETTTSINIDNFKDLLRIIIKLDETGLFKRKTESYFGGKTNYTEYFLSTTNSIVLEFNEKYNKLLDAKEIIGDEIFKMSLESLLEKYNDIDIKDSKNENVK